MMDELGMTSYWLSISSPATARFGEFALSSLSVGDGASRCHLRQGCRCARGGCFWWEGLLPSKDGVGEGKVDASI